MSKKYCKHTWSEEMVKVVPQVKFYPGAVNYLIAGFFPVKICVECRKIKDNKIDETLST